MIDGEKHEIRHNKYILIETAQWLIRQGHLDPSDTPIFLTEPTKYLIDREPRHPTPDRKGKYDVLYPKQISNGLWMHTNFSIEDSIDHAKLLLRKYGFPDSILDFVE